jgi:predicted ferric reductase
MILIIRGILWYGLYLFMILLPIGMATVAAPARAAQPFLVEAAVGMGFIGFSLMALEFALITRFEAADAPFGEDSLQLFHNIMGSVALGFILAHPALLIIAGYPANCWLNPFSICANLSTQTAFLSVVILLLLIGTSIWRKQLRLKYEPWRILHGIFALAVVFSALIHMVIIGRYTSSPVMQVVWLIYSVLLIVLIVWYKIWTPLHNWERPWRILENRQERGGARTLVLQPDGHQGFSFLPGQFSWIITGRTPFSLQQHPISMSSMADIEAGESVHFTIKDLGDWSGTQVPAFQPGDKLWLDGPHGVFSMDREQAMGYVFIAGGVGITPLYSMIQTMANRQDVRPVLLFYGAQNSESMTFRDELLDLSGEMENLQVIPVFTEPEDGWEGETGYIREEILKKYLPKQYKRFIYLICGPEVLMDAMEEALPNLGIPRMHVLSERFDMV